MTEGGARTTPRQAAAALADGQVIGLPTETVYGLAADATNRVAVKKVFALKGRPENHPLILHVGERDWLRRYCDGDLERAEALAHVFWPGPLTLVLRRKPEEVIDEVTGGLPTVAVRMPAHDMALDVIRILNRPVAAPSANRFGAVSPTTAYHVMKDFGGELPLVLDGGPCEIGLESTILDLSRTEPKVLRPGAIVASELSEILGVAVGGDDGQGAAAPGTLPSHYAPRAEVRIVEDTDVLCREAQRQHDRGNKVGIIWVASSARTLNSDFVVVDLSESPQVLAHELYDALRRLDEAGCDLILTQMPPPEGIGEAVCDRLTKASAPRDLP